MRVRRVLQKSTFYTVLAIGLLVASSGMLMAQGKGKKGNGGGGDDGGGDPPPPMPAVRYELKLVDSPGDATQLNDANNLGQVVGWVSFTQENGSYGPWLAYIANTATSEFTLLESIVDSSNLPEGFFLSSAVGINDHGVVVGYAANEAGDRIPYAVDLSFVNPVVDLLPSMGLGREWARRINNRGEIVSVFYDDPNTAFLAYSNPGIYGDPGARIVRDGDGDGIADALPLDLSQESPVSLMPFVGSTNTAVHISNPADGTPTYIASTTLPDGVPFRIEVGASSAEFLTDFRNDGAVRGLDASGVVVGTGLAPAPKGRKLVSFNYRYGTQLELLPDEGVPAAAGRVGEVLLTSSYSNSSSFPDFAVYRDWQDGLGPRLIDIDFLVTGEVWDQFAAGDKWAWGMTSEGHIFGKILNGAPRMFMLFEGPADEPNP